MGPDDDVIRLDGVTKTYQAGAHGVPPALDDLTVEDNVLLPAQLAGASRRTARARARELLEQMGIERHRDDYPARLSGGQRQHPPAPGRGADRHEKRNGRQRRNSPGQVQRLPPGPRRPRRPVTAPDRRVAGRGDSGHESHAMPPSRGCLSGRVQHRWWC